MAERVTPDESELLFAPSTLAGMLAAVWSETGGYTALLSGLSRANRQLELQALIELLEARTAGSPEAAPDYHLTDRYPLRVWESRRDNADINKVRVRASETMRVGYAQDAPYVRDSGLVVGGMAPYAAEVAFPVPPGLSSADRVFTTPSSATSYPCRIAENSLLMPREADPFETGLFQIDETPQGRSAILWLQRAGTDRMFPYRMLAWYLGDTAVVPTRYRSAVTACIAAVVAGGSRESLSRLAETVSGGPAVFAATTDQAREMWPDGLYVPAEVTGCAGISLAWDTTRQIGHGIPFYLGDGTLSEAFRQRTAEALADSGVDPDELYTGVAGVDERDGVRYMRPAEYMHANMLAGKLVYEQVPGVTNRDQAPAFAWPVAHRAVEASGLLFVFTRLSCRSDIDIEVLAGNAACYVYNKSESRTRVSVNGTAAHVIPKSLCGRLERHDTRDNRSNRCRTCG